MVGRLVEQQQVGRAHQRARQLQPHAPAAGEAVDGLRRARAPLKPRPRISACARGTASCRRRRPGRVVGVRRWPCRRRLASAARQVARWLDQAGVAAQHEVGRAARRFPACPARPAAERQCGGMEKSPPSSCRRPLSSANSVDLPAPLRPTRPTFSPGLRVTLARVEHDLGAAAQSDVGRERACRDFRRRRRGALSARLSRLAAVRNQGAALDQDDLVSPALVSSQAHFEVAEGVLEVGALVADLQHQHRRRRSGGPARRATMRRTRSMPSVPPASASAGSARYSAGQRAPCSAR